MRTFLDSGVFSHGWRSDHLSDVVMQIIDDESREFFSSQMVRLELLPKPRFEQRVAEVAFYEDHFRDCSFIEPLSEELGLHF